MVQDRSQLGNTSWATTLHQRLMGPFLATQRKACPQVSLRQEQKKKREVALDQQAGAHSFPCAELSESSSSAPASCLFTTLLLMLLKENRAPPQPLPPFWAQSAAPCQVRGL